MITVAAPIACSACDGGQVEIQYSSAHDYVTGDEFAVLDCAKCGLRFTYPLPVDMGRYYPATYRAYREPVLYFLRALYRMRAQSWARKFDKPGEMLEIGCGPGLMLEAMRDRGWKTTG